jgi:hypothetical protein
MLSATYAFYTAMAGAIAGALKRLLLGMLQYPVEAWTPTAWFVITVGAWSIYIGGCAGWLYGLWNDARDIKVAMLAADLMVPPLGAIRGALKYFGML